MDSADEWWQASFENPIASQGCRMLINLCDICSVLVCSMVEVHTLCAMLPDIEMEEGRHSDSAYLD